MLLYYQGLKSLINKKYKTLKNQIMPRILNNKINKIQFNLKNLFYYIVFLNKGFKTQETYFLFYFHKSFN